eukprot:CAMPEP_0168328982 /NCGR_PEP_ID=MMETSP0213-20121227/6835_1 /TAXON_ID=151035 /ORGANISM="Euplotes harpa, Strain FSP1.4" /LENGTH=69 /DNA_ID=CAMNT_0008332217 /DNA_START=25 /DNA_END=234 /DNA_ORIENTATION=-
MNRGFNEAQAEMSVMFINQAISFCNKAVFKQDHKAKVMNDYEKSMYKNCLKKYLSGPSVFGPAVQSSQM